MKLFNMNIYGGIYSVEYKALESQGEAHMDKQVIYLNKDYPLEHQRVTLLHEVLHVCFQARWQYQVDAISQVTDVGLKEHLLIDPIASSLHDVIKNNQDFRRFLWGDITI